MSQAWQSPHEIAPVRVFGVVLRGPVTLGHVLLLHELASPVPGGETIGIGDLALAVAVCSQSDATTARNAIKSRWSTALMRWWARRCGRMDWAKEAATFTDWFSAQCGGPVAVVDAGERKAGPKHPISAPWYISKLALGIAELGLSQEECEAMPVKRLNQLLAALMEARGLASFRTPLAEDFIEEAKRWQAENLPTE